MRTRPVCKPPRTPPGLPRLHALAKMSATCQQGRARSNPLAATCARRGPPAHPRATIVRWASDNGEQHDQSAGLPRTQPCSPRLPAMANTCALLASKDSRARIHFQQLCAPPTHPRATIICTGPVITESSTTSPQAFRTPNHACPDSPHWQTHARYLPARTRALGSTSSNLRATWATRAPTRHHYALGQ